MDETLYAELSFLFRRCGHHLKPEEQERIQAVLDEAKGEPSEPSYRVLALDDEGREVEVKQG